MGTYSAQEHRFRFAAWAAGRAYSRGGNGLTGKAALQSLESVGLKAIAMGLCKLPPTAEEFDKKHADWCNALQCHFSQRKVKKGKAIDLTYGRAAKLVNVYLKALFLSDFGRQTPTNENEAELLSRTNHIHPPIDRLLLDNLMRADQQNSSHWKSYRYHGWTKFAQNEYLEVIKLISCVTEGKLWQIEEYWPAGSQSQ